MLILPFKNDEVAEVASVRVLRFVYMQSFFAVGILAK